MTTVDMDVRAAAARKLAKAYGDAEHEEAIVDFLCNVSGKDRTEDFQLYATDRRFYRVTLRFEVSQLDCSLCKGSGESITWPGAKCPMCEGRGA